MTPPRIPRLKTALQEAHLDGFLAVSPTATCTLSGCHLLTQTVIPEREAYVLVTAAGDVSYLVCSIEEKSAVSHSWIKEIYTYTEFSEVPATRAADLLREKGLAKGKIGVEMRALSAASLAHLQRTLPEAEFVGWDEGYDQMIMIKDPHEIEALSDAGEKTRLAIIEGLTGAPVGSTELEVANRILSRIMAAGIVAQFNVFAAGPHINETHAEATNRVLEPGDLIRLDMGGRMAGTNYLSDMARTAVVGPPTSEQTAIYTALFDIQKLIFAACDAGRPVADLYHVCAAGFENHRLPFRMPHIGHGMGIGLHEAPIIHPGNTTPLQPGMVLNIEPHVSLFDRDESYHIEDLVLITRDGPLLMTTPTPELIQLSATA